MNLLRMGVMNVTPNSFSDGGELSLSSFQKKIISFGEVEALDIGAESTAPMNGPISWKEEWERLKPYMPLLGEYKGILSFDTYHTETIEEILRWYKDHGWDREIIWNDVSGKFDGLVYDFLSMSPKFSYVLCHNLAPTRALTGKHMDYVDPHLTLEKIRDFFLPFSIPRIIFDPCLGFSKTFEQNWEILNRFGELQKMTGHHRWLLGFSRKSFLRKKFNLTINDRDELDRVHNQVLSRLEMHGEVWIRTHRPDLVSLKG
jgi:dihydropteroate synthase